MDVYTHITSPIRRIVDLLNMIQLQQNLSIINLSEKAYHFYNKWTTFSSIEYINTSVKSIRKIQNECTLLEMYTNHPEKLENIYEGYIIECIDNNKKNIELFKYLVYLPELKITMQTTVHEYIENYDKRNFQLYLFQDEESLKKNIRFNLSI